MIEIYDFTLQYNDQSRCLFSSEKWSWKMVPSVRLISSTSFLRETCDFKVESCVQLTLLFSVACVLRSQVLLFLRWAYSLLTTNGSFCLLWSLAVGISFASLSFLKQSKLFLERYRFNLLLILFSLSATISSFGLIFLNSGLYCCTLLANRSFLNKSLLFWLLFYKISMTSSC